MSDANLARALADAFTTEQLALIEPYLTRRAVDARATSRRDAADALARLGDAVTIAQAHHRRAAAGSDPAETRACEPGGFVGAGGIVAEHCPACGDVFHPEQPGSGERCATCRYHGRQPRASEPAPFDYETARAHSECDPGCPHHVPEPWPPRPATTARGDLLDPGER